MSNLDICYKYLHNKLEPSDEDWVVLKRYKLSGKPYLIEDKRATRAVLSDYIKSCDNGYSGGFDKFCRTNKRSDMRKDKNSRDLGYRTGDTKGAHILMWAFIILVIYVIIMQ